MAEVPDALDEILPVGPRTAAAAALRAAPDRVGDLEFDFMDSAELRAIVERDVRELRAADGHELHKCTAILAGSIVEGLLVDLLNRKPDLAQGCTKKPQDWPDKASLGELVKFARKMNLVEATAETMVLKLTDFRDIVHPDRERRHGTQVDGATAAALIALLRLVVRDLIAAEEDGRIAAYVKT